jgi:hypothetical protein
LDKTFSFFVFVRLFCFPYHFYYFAPAVECFSSGSPLLFALLAGYENRPPLFLVS